jgi:hypothetical protein
VGGGVADELLSRLNRGLALLDLPIGASKATVRRRMRAIIRGHLLGGSGSDDHDCALASAVVLLAEPCDSWRVEAGPLGVRVVWTP